MLSLLAGGALAFAPPRAAPRAAARATPRMAVAASGPAAAAAAAAIAASLSAAPLDASLAQQLYAGPSAGAHAPTSIVLGATETKEGLYGTYQVEKAEQKYDDARSTFKSKEATKAGRNKYIPVFAVLLVGSFIIPMAQYFWCAPRARELSRAWGARVPALRPRRARARRLFAGAFATPTALM